jgi:hypothetical protein
MDTMAMSSLPATVQRRTTSFSISVVLAVVCFSPSTSSGKSWRLYTGSVERPTGLPDVGEYEPSGECTPARPSVTHAGSGVLLIVLPAAMSSEIHFATCCQPAACHVSNGPIFQPKPQRIAKSRSRAQCAMSPRCTAQ